MAYLYVNTKGSEWRKHSYSAGNDYDSSPYKYYLRRVLGWREKDNKGAFKFGRALEEAIQFFHDNNGLGGVEDFVQRWQVHKDNPEIKYTKTEKDWACLLRAGSDMMRLYEIRQPSLPFPLGGQTVFQREYSKEVFPGDPNYGEILDAGKLDMIGYVEPDHPMLPKMDWKPEWGALRPVIGDIKTSALDFPETPGIAAFDKQLRRYSWLTGVPTVGLVWFKKAGINLSKGVSCTLLQDAFGYGFNAGSEVVVAHVEDEDKVWIVRDDYFVEVMEKAQGRKANGNLDTTKEAMKRKTEWIENNAVRVPGSYLTRQRLQFNCGIVSEESAGDAGMIAARQIVAIVNSWKTKRWPNTFGIRFPSDDTNDPYFKAFVLGDKMFKDQHFIKSSEEDFDLLEEEPEAE